MTAVSNSEARKRAQEAVSNSESATGDARGPNRGVGTFETLEGRESAAQDSGAIGRLNEAQWADLLATLPEDPEVALGWELSLVRRTVERIVREHTDRALAEVEQAIDQCGVRTDSAERWGITTALHVVRDYRAARQEQS